MKVAARRTGLSRRVTIVAMGLAPAACAPHAGPEQGLSAFVIEKPAIIRQGNPAPQYPAELLGTGDTATVRLRVAVAPSGRADSASVEVLESPHPAFTRAVLEVLPRYRFLPAETGGGPPRNCRTNPDGTRSCQPGRPGTKVRSLVEIPFHFVPPAPTPPSSGSQPG